MRGVLILLFVVLFVVGCSGGAWPGGVKSVVSFRAWNAVDRHDGASSQGLTLVHLDGGEITKSCSSLILRGGGGESSRRDSKKNSSDHAGASLLFKSPRGGEGKGSWRVEEKEGLEWTRGEETAEEIVKQADEGRFDEDIMDVRSSVTSSCCYFSAEISASPNHTCQVPRPTIY